MISMTAATMLILAGMQNREGGVLMFDLAVMVISEFCLLIGGIIGFLFALSFYDFNKKKPEKIKKTIPRAKEKRPKRVSNSIMIHPMGQKKNNSANKSVDISSKIPSKDLTWTEVNCACDEKDGMEEIKNNRSREDNAYSILKRKMNNKKGQ